jgi:uncharacterized membrane protein
MSTTKLMQFPSRNWIYESLFWLHVAVILAGLLMGLVLPLPIVVIAVIIHRLHVLMFDGCILSKYQASKNGLSRSENFLQHMVQRFAGIKMSKKNASILDYGIALSSIIIAVLVQKFNMIYSIEHIVVCLFILWGAYTCYQIIGSKKSQPVQIPTEINVCVSVQESQFSRVKGMPIEYIGLGYFGFLFIMHLTMHSLGLYNILFLPFAGIVFVAFLVSLGFICIQCIILKNICTMCMNVHGASIFLAFFTIYRLYN